MGRGTPITLQQEQEFLELVAQGNTVTQAAKQLGLSPSPFYKRLRDEGAFATTFKDEARPQFRDTIEQTLLDIALGRVKPTHPSQVTALIIALKRYDPEYRESQQRLEITGAGGGPIQTVRREVSLASIYAYAERVGGDLTQGDSGPRGDLSAPRALPAGEEPKG